MSDYEIVFVGGAPRSGTTLVQKMLNAHSEIYGGPEFDRLGDIVHLRNLLQFSNNKGRSEAYYNSEMLDKKVSEFIVNLLKEPAINNKAKIICEKTPNNIFHMNNLLNIHTAAKGIIVVRDPRGIVASMKNVRNKAKDANQKVPGFTKSTNNSITFIKKYWNAGLTAVNNHKERIKIVVYEDLIANTEKVLNELCEFLKISFDLSMIKPGESNFDRGVKQDNIWYTGKDHQRNIDASSLEKWRTSLDKLDQELIEQNLMEFYNYWLNLNNNKSSLSTYPIENNHGFRMNIVKWLAKNERIRAMINRLIKDSYSISR